MAGEWGNMPAEFTWWQKGVIYQIYPRSFQDSNGDGIGDLRGIAARLDYLASLGVDAIWLSPIFPSPMADFGYDVSNYTGIDPVFGTLQDFDALIAAAHAWGLKLLLDYVPNHSSDRHAWFEQSRSSRSNPKRDWYIWRDARPDGGPPNNWLSEFGGSAWSWDARTGQYYYHAYLKEQPDLDWRNPELRAEMLEVLRFWFRRGVDGFRVDAIHHLVEDEALRDNPPNPDWQPGMPDARRLLRLHTMDQPEVHAAVAEMRRVADEFGGRLMIGEAYLPIQQLMRYYGEGLAGFHLPFNFHLISSSWDPASIASLIGRYEAALPQGAWPNWVLGNHDRSRLASRIGPAQARVAAMLLLTLRGTPTLYQGEEIGMTDVAIPPERVQDPWEKNVPGCGRDPVRTPMQWDASPNAGFTTGEPWLPLAPNAELVNVAVQAEDPRSMLSLYHRLLALRRAEPSLAVGSYGRLWTESNVLAYERRQSGRTLTIALNFGSEPERLELLSRPGRVLLSTHADRAGETVGSTLPLRPDEGVIIE
jgi:alpha-glucosidase